MQIFCLVPILTSFLVFFNIHKIYTQDLSLLEVVEKKKWSFWHCSVLVVIILNFSTGYYALRASYAMKTD